MLVIENPEVLGWEHVIRGMRNPMNSWAMSDSFLAYGKPKEGDCVVKTYSDEYDYVLGAKDQGLMAKLRDAGTDHRKFMRMIVVYLDITAPLYWWKEFDTYKVGTVANSCSTMHKIADKEFVLEDFSCEHLYALCGDSEVTKIKKGDYLPSAVLNQCIIPCLNQCRELYLATKAKIWWWQMIQLLPTSYNQKRTIMLNYEVLANLYVSRRHHKLDEWHVLCDWIETLPQSELITGKGVCDAT